MKRLFTLWGSLLCAFGAIGQNQPPLYPIREGNLFGYINTGGQTVIQPRFRAAGPFAEGLAPVRLQGTYGYIDPHGTFAIAPQFDLAYPFQHGLAKVYRVGKPYIIDTKGRILFEHSYRDITPFESHTYAVVTTASDKQGLINRAGKLIVDTAFTKINSFSDGLAVVLRQQQQAIAPSDEEGNKRPTETGVIDTTGRTIVDYGRYPSIRPFVNGFADVEFEKFTTADVIDTHGNSCFSIPRKKWSFPDQTSFQQGLRVVDIYTVDMDTVKVWSSKRRYDYKGAVNTKGEIVFSNPNWCELSPFSANRTFAKDTSGKWFLINTRGERVTSQAFDRVLYDPYENPEAILFENGMAFVEVNEEWGAIDTSGHYVVPPRSFTNMDSRRMQRVGNALIMTGYSRQEDDEPAYHYGFWNMATNVFVKPVYHEINTNTIAGNGLIYVIRNDLMSYLNPAGVEVWREHAVVKHHQQFNIDFMNRAYCYAASGGSRSDADLNGAGDSENRPKRLSRQKGLPATTPQLLFDTKRVLGFTTAT